MKNYTKILLLISLISFGLNSFAQEREVRKLSPDKKHKVGSDMIYQGSYYNAVGHMEELVKAHPDNKKYLTKLAEAYFFSRDYKNAEIWYKKIVDMEADKISSSLFRYAETLKYNAKYKEAKEAFQKFSNSKYSDKRGENFKNYAKNEIESCAWAIQNQNNTQPVDIVHLGDHVNSKYGEFAPLLWNDSTLVFSSLQSDSVITITPDEAHAHMVHIYSSPQQGKEWGPHTLVPTVNTTFEDNANGALSTDKKRFYFTRCIIDDDTKKPICAIYVSKIEDGKLGKATKLSAKINKKGYTATQPNIATVTVNKRKQEILYFSSNRSGGRGGLDIWYALADSKGNFGSVTNAGKEVNSIRDEITPFYDTTSSTLYFSSNFHFGYGGYDVFSSKGELTKLEKPVNIGLPVNTRVDDYYFTIIPDRFQGFVASNRPEGYHLTSETCCDDIYSHNLNNNTLVTKIAAFNNSTDKKELAKLKIRLLEKQLSSDTNDFPQAIFAGDSVKQGLITTILTADSARMLNKKNIVNSFKANGQIESALPNTLIASNKFKELPNTDNSYILKSNTDYLAAAYTEKDTIYYLFRLDENKQIVKSISFDTSSVKVNTHSVNDIRISNIEFFFNKNYDSSAFVKAKPEPKVEQTVENEKSNTVSRVFKDLEASVNKDLKIILNYDFDDTKFIEKHSGSLDSLVLLMKKYPKVKIRINAHTDSKGTDEYNNDLSKRRAKSIVDYLTSRGVNKKRMHSKGFGETLPLVPNENPDGSDSPENRWLNRRAEIEIIET